MGLGSGRMKSFDLFPDWIEEPTVQFELISDKEDCCNLLSTTSQASQLNVLYCIRRNTIREYSEMCSKITKQKSFNLFIALNSGIAFMKAGATSGLCFV